MKIIMVCGARPNFIKIAPLIRAVERFNNQNPKKTIDSVLVHTGQHYDYKMSEIFFQDMNIPKPDVHLNVGSGTFAEQTSKIMVEFDKCLVNINPSLVLVVGDVNSTIASALVAVQRHIRVAHVEAGLRSYDRTMPEEINRILTDAISDYLFTTVPDASVNLIKEGVPEEKIFLVGDVMIDSLLYHQTAAKNSNILSKLNLSRDSYGLLTLHRQSNVDIKENLSKVMNALIEISKQVPIVFPVHVRTRKRLEEFNLLGDIYSQNDRIRLIEPLGFLDFLNLEMNSKFIMTDSGGIQTEATVLNIPCLTLRENTERPITITHGTNILVGTDTGKIIEQAFAILKGQRKINSLKYEFYDGKAAERIIGVISTLR